MLEGVAQRFQLRSQLHQRQRTQAQPQCMRLGLSTFLRPVWRSQLRALAWAEHRGRTISHYLCEIRREDDRVIARIVSAVMILQGGSAQGR